LRAGVLRVRVRYFTTLRELAGKAEEEVIMGEGATLAELVGMIASKYGEEARNYLYQKREKGKVDPSIHFLINGENSRIRSGLDTRLRHADVVAIIPPIGGG